MKDIAKAGIRKLVMVTSHGGNSSRDEPDRAGIARSSSDARRDDGVGSPLRAPETLFAAEEVQHGIHGGAVETSIMLARHGEKVRP